jgi:hypothetical protein
MSFGYFDRLAGLGGRILNTLGGADRTTVVNEYLRVLSGVYTVLAQIHGHVLDVTLDVGVAKDRAEAEAALERLQALGLESVIRAQDLCNELERLGHQLTGIEGLSGGGDAAEWEQFRSVLQRREAGTSELYDEKLYELRTLAHREPDLEALKRIVQEVSHNLVVQKAEFEWLAKRARKELEHP